MVYDNGEIYHRRQRHIPIWSEDRKLVETPESDEPSGDEQEPEDTDEQES